MRAFDFKTATTLEQALALLSDPAARPLAGGTDLLVQLRRGARTAGLLVDVKSIPELRRLEVGGKGMVLGAAVTGAEVRDHPEIRRRYPALAEAAGLVGGAAIQNRATIGGNLCNAAPSADTIPVLLVHDGVCLVAGPDGRRTVPVAEFCTGPGRTVLGPGEILVAVELPAPAAHSGAAYLRFTPRHEMDIAVAGAGVWLRLEKDRVVDARVALSAVAPTPLPVPEAAQALVGRPADEEAFGAAGEAAARTARPIDDVRGGGDQRRRLVEVLTRRAARAAARRARGEEVSHG